MKHSLIYLFISICFFIFVIPVLAQQSTNSGSTVLTYIHDIRIEELVRKHIELNEKNPNINGYRVQIFFDSGNNSRENAIKIKSDFILQHPDINCYLLWQQPNYKLRVGDFRTKIEAQGFLEKIRNEYKNAFIVKDKISFPFLDHTD